MKLLANEEGRPGLNAALNALRAGKPGMDAIVSGVSEVERSLDARSVGYGGWPNLIGVMEFDASVMDGDTLQSGAVGGLQGIVSAVKVARLVMDESPHEILIGDGAQRFALDAGMELEETLYEDSRRTWQQTLAASFSHEQLQAFPDGSLAALPVISTNPELMRDTTVFLSRDVDQSLATASSTSGWAFKHPGRLGDAPICGAGFYADSAVGAVACTHTGEMTIRAATSSSIVNAMRAGASIDDAVQFGIDGLKRLRKGFLGGVVIHAMDAGGAHRVANFRCGEHIRYWLWSDVLSEPQLRDAEIVVE